MIKEVDAQCMNWALWIRGAGIAWPGPRNVRSWWGPMVLDPNMGAASGGAHAKRVTRIDEIGARALHQCILKLPVRLRRTLRQHYLRGGTKEQKAKAVGCSPRTFYDWLDEAHQALAAMVARNTPGKKFDTPEKRPISGHFPALRSDIITTVE